MPNASRIPTINVSIVEPDTTLVSRVWFRFFQLLNTIDSGVYTPTLTNTTNITSSSAAVCQYTQIYSVVTVSGQVTIQATIAGPCNLKVTIPVPSNFTSVTQASGVMASTAYAQNRIGAVVADVTNQQFEFIFVPAGTASTTYSFTATYQIV